MKSFSNALWAAAIVLLTGSTLALPSTALDTTNGLPEDERGIVTRQYGQNPPPTPLAPPIPSVDECKRQLNVPKDGTIFYSGPSNYIKLVQKIVLDRPYLHGYQTLSRSWKDPQWPWQWAVSGREAMLKNCGRALAELTTGTVYIMLPPGEGKLWDETTFWAQSEWPYIPKDVRVIRIDPYDPEATQVIQEMQRSWKA